MAPFNGVVQFRIFSVLIFIAKADGQGPCVTPRSEAATCVPLSACPDLKRALGTVQPSAIKFFTESLCQNGRNAEDVPVCCGKTGYFANATTEPLASSTATPATTTDAFGRREFAKRELLPSLVYCGYQHTDDYYYKGNATALDEFPWLAHMVLRIQGNGEDTETWRCSGVLISYQYVLTTEKCAAYSVGVRLGQHITRKNVSCIGDPLVPECNEQLDVTIERVIRRLDNQSTSPYDFVLLRLNRTITYTEYIRPVCLPFDEATKPPDKDTPLSFSGWGSPHMRSVTKKRLAFKRIDEEECFKIYKQLKGDTENVTLMCLKSHGTNAESVCLGNEGGSLMYEYNSPQRQWFIEGLVAEVEQGFVIYCELPLTALKITRDVLDWILDNVEP